MVREEEVCLVPGGQLFLSAESNGIELIFLFSLKGVRQSPVSYHTSTRT